MYRNPEDFPEYGYDEKASPYGPDYAHPDFYQQHVPAMPRSAQPVQPLDPYAGYNNNQLSYDEADLNEYRGPSTIEAYTTNDQQGTAADGNATGKRRRRGLAGLGGIGATVGALLLKLQGFAFLLKFGLAGITALASIAVYSFFLGWHFAVGLVILLFIHEMGHALVMKLKGIPVGSLIFIPMLGAAVSMRQMPQNARDEAEVGIAGPIAGAIAASVCFLFASMPLADPIWAPLAYFGFFMNLFNLIPIVPFDGGRVLAAIDRRVWIVGFILLLGFQIWSWIHGNFSIWLILFVFLAASQLWSRGASANTLRGKAYYDVPVATRIILSLLYFGLAAVLYLGMMASHNLMVGILN